MSWTSKPLRHNRRIARAHSSKRRLGVEPLERRNLMAVYTVDSLVDVSDGNFSTGNLSLREAIEQSNAGLGEDTINFKAGLTGAMTLAGTELPITDSVAINGPGANILAISGNHASRLFNIASGTVSITGLELRDGVVSSESGGAIKIASGSTVVLDRLYIHDNQSFIHGGAITIGNANVTIISSTLSGNQATGSGGAIVVDAGTPGDPAVPNVQVIDSTISTNTASYGGGLYLWGNTTQVTNCTIYNNIASLALGGGIYLSNDELSFATLHNTLVAGNTEQGNPKDFSGKNVETSSSNNLIGDAASAGGITHGTNGNIVGNAGSGTIDLTTVLLSTLANYGGPTPTHLLVLGSPALDAGSNALALNQNGAALTTDQRGRGRRADRNGDGLATVDMGAVELQPFALGLSGSVSYTENAPYVLLSAGATLAAFDNLIFSNSTLRVTNAVSPHVDDRLQVRNQGTAAAQIGVSGINITYSGIVIGTFRGGNGATPLAVTFNANANYNRVLALAQNIVFRSNSQNPPTSPRSIRFLLDDGRGSTTNTATKTVNVTRVNDAPIIGRLGANVSFTENGPAVGLAVAATVVDYDSPNFDAGKLVAKLTTNAEATDRLLIRALNGVSTNGNEVIVEGQVIGNFSGGVGNTGLTVLFNSLANASTVQSVLRSLAYQSVSENPSSNPRTFSVIAYDGDGATGVGAAVTKQILVSRINDAPVIAPANSGTVGYSQNSPAMVLLTAATLKDPDSSNLAGGFLQVHIAAGSNASNRLDVGGVYRIVVVDSVQTVVFNNSVTIGTLDAGAGIGTVDLMIRFNENATLYRVEQLLKSIKFRTQNGVSTASRSIGFTVNDGDGGLSNTATVNVQVS